MTKKKDIERIVTFLKENAILFSVYAVNVDTLSSHLNLEVIYLTDLLVQMEQAGEVRVNRLVVPFEVSLVNE